MARDASSSAMSTSFPVVQAEVDLIYRLFISRNRHQLLEAGKCRKKSDDG